MVIFTFQIYNFFHFLWLLHFNAFAARECSFSRFFLLRLCFTSFLLYQLECIKIGGNLASIHNSDENNFLSELVQQVTAKTGVRAWVGGSDAVRVRKSKNVLIVS